MHNPFRYFLFFVILFFPSVYFVMSNDLRGNIYYIVLAYSLLIPLITFPIYKEKSGLVNQKNGTILKKDAKHGSAFAKAGLVMLGLIGFVYSWSHFSVVCNSNEMPLLCLPSYVFGYTILGLCAGFVIGAVIGLAVDLVKK